MQKSFPKKPDAHLALPITRALVLSELAGQYLAMREIERKRGRRFNWQLASGNWQVAIFQDEIPSAYDEAVRFFLSKLILPKDEFTKLEAEARRRAFTVYIDSRAVVLEVVKASLEAALESGMAREEWAADIAGVFDRAGVTEVNPHYLDTVFLTNIQEGLNRGKDAIYEETDPEEFPMFTWFTVGDDRVRDSHADLDGFTWERNDPIWDLLKPPLSYRCRCGRSLVYREDGLTPSSPAKYAEIFARASAGGRGFEFVK